MQDVVAKLVFKLERGKSSPISLYIFHVYDKYECLRKGEASMPASLQVMLQFDIAAEVEVQLDNKDEDLERELLGCKEIW